MNKTNKPFLVVTRSIDKHSRLNIEILTMYFQYCYKRDAADDLAIEAREYGSDINFFTNLCAKIRKDTATDSNPKGKTTYYQNIYGRGFVLQAQRDLDSNSSHKWYGLSIFRTDFAELCLRALLKIVGAYSPREALNKLPHVFAMRGNDSSELLPSTTTIDIFLDEEQPTL